MNAVLLAGSLNNGLYKSSEKIPYEALIPVGTKLMVQHVIDALLNSQYINKIVIVGPGSGIDLIYKDNNRVIFVKPGISIVENVRKGYTLLRDAIIEDTTTDDKILVITSDLPLITGQAVDDFIISCREEKADLFYSIIPKLKIEESYPEAKRTYVNLKEGIFTGGNAVIVRTKVIENCLVKGKELIELRKKPLSLCRVVGVTFLVKYLIKKLSLKEAESKVSMLLGIRGKAVVSDYPEIGMDVDKPSDLDLVNKVLLNRKCF